MEGIHRQLLEGEQWVGDSTGPFFGFMGAAAALVFACARPPRALLLRQAPARLLARARNLLGWRAWPILAAPRVRRGGAGCSPACPPALAGPAVP